MGIKLHYVKFQRQRISGSKIMVLENNLFLWELIRVLRKLPGRILQLSSLTSGPQSMNTSAMVKHHDQKEVGKMWYFEYAWHTRSSTVWICGLVGGSASL